MKGEGGAPPSPLSDSLKDYKLKNLKQNLKEGKFTLVINQRHF